jgi:hypothetical protein
VSSSMTPAARAWRTTPTQAASKSSVTKVEPLRTLGAALLQARGSWSVDPGGAPWGIRFTVVVGGNGPCNTTETRRVGPATPFRRGCSLVIVLTAAQSAVQGESVIVPGPRTTWREDSVPVGLDRVDVVRQWIKDSRIHRIFRIPKSIYHVRSELLRISRMTTATTRGNQRDYRSDQGPGETLVGFWLRPSGCRTHASGRRSASSRADQVRLAQPGGWQGGREDPKQPSDLTDHQEAAGKAAVRRYRLVLPQISMVRPRQKV